MRTVFIYPSELLDTPAGRHLGYSDWMTIDQERINRFAAATDDRQWIHVDEERAKDGPFGTTIAHGYLTSSLANKFLMEVVEVQNVKMAINYGTEKVRFPAVVPVGSRIRGGCELVSAKAIKSGVQVVIRVTIEIEGSSRPACVVDTISRFFPHGSPGTFSAPG